MRTFTLLALLALCQYGASQSGDAQSDPRNAATWYQRAIEQYMTLPEAQRDLLVNGYDPAGGPPSPEMRMALANVQSVFATLQRGSSQESADFGLDYEQGFELMLPHLQPLRQITRAAKTDAMVRLQDGDTNGAAERLSSLYRLAGHGGDDRILISSLVGQAIFSAADDAVQFGADRGNFNAADAAKLLGAAKSLGANDPFQYLESVAGEQEVAVNWLTKKFEESPTPEDFAKFLTQFDGDHPQWQELALSEENFQSALDQYDGVMTRVVEAFANPDAEAAKAALDQIAGEMERGEHGPLAAVMVPAFAKLLEAKLKSEAMLAARIAMLEGLVSGEVKPEEAANAALWYLRGLEKLAGLEPAQIAAIRSAAGSPTPTINEQLVAVLESKPVQEMIELLEEASQKKRCDFKAATKREQTAFIAAYVPGMNDALKTLRLETIRQLARTSDDGRVQAFVHLGLTLRAIGHLGGDPLLSSALVGHSNFISTAKVIGDMAKADAIDTPQREAIATAMERISRRDPFGYVEAIMQTREALARTLKYRNATNEDHKARLAHSAELIEGFNGDQLLMIACTFDVMNRAGKTDDDKDAAPATDLVPPGMADVMSADAAAVVRAAVAQIAPALAMDDWSVLADTPLTVIATPGVVERMRRARADVRDMAAVLRPVPESEVDVKE